MPMYEYRCEKCGHVFEELILSSADRDAAVQCPKCGSKSVQRLMSGFAVGASGSTGAACPTGTCPLG